jgi:hypothetical protein
MTASAALAAILAIAASVVALRRVNQPALPRLSIPSS